MGLMEKIFGDLNEKEVKKVSKIADRVMSCLLYTSIQILINEIDVPIIVDAGIGRPSQACEAMEMGAAAIMANTALATAGDLPMMASAFKKAIEAGRKAYLSGLGRVLVRGAAASDPLTGFLRD